MRQPGGWIITYWQRCSTASAVGPSATGNVLQNHCELCGLLREVANAPCFTGMPPQSFGASQHFADRCREAFSVPHRHDCAVDALADVLDNTSRVGGYDPDVAHDSLTYGQAEALFPE